MNYIDILNGISIPGEFKSLIESGDFEKGIEFLNNKIAEKDAFFASCNTEWLYWMTAADHQYFICLKSILEIASIDRAHDFPNISFPKDNGNLIEWVRRMEKYNMIMMGLIDHQDAYCDTSNFEYSEMGIVPT